MTASTAAPHSNPDVSYPNTWILTSHKIGDNNQVLALASTLGWPYETKTIVRRENRLTSKLIYRQWLGITLAGIDLARSSQLKPPWPDLVISASRANEMVARWIRKMSGGHTRLVHIGRPKSPLEAFDLIITTPQYFLPERNNILSTDLPLHRVTPEHLEESAAKWQPRLSHLRRPYTVVLVGGDTGEFVLSGETGRRLGQEINKLSLACGGSVLVTNSARTPPASFHELLRQLTVPAHIYHWNDGADDNPFYGYLALADQLVVTAESTSMLAEASATGKPLYMFDISGNQYNGISTVKGPGKRYFRGLIRFSLGGRITKRFKAQRFQRNIGNIQQLLLNRGRASWLGDPLPDGMKMETATLVSRDLQRAAARVRHLFHE